MFVTEKRLRGALERTDASLRSADDRNYRWLNERIEELEGKLQALTTHLQVSIYKSPKQPLYTASSYKD
jgi:hypothetical protein